VRSVYAAMDRRDGGHEVLEMSDDGQPQPVTSAWQAKLTFNHSTADITNSNC